MTGPVNRMAVPITKPTKAIVAGIGGALQAACVFWAAVSLATSDDAFDVNEVSSLLAALLTFVGTVMGVYKTLNKPAD